MVRITNFLGKKLLQIIHISIGVIVIFQQASRRRNPTSFGRKLNINSWKSRSSSTGNSRSSQHYCGSPSFASEVEVGIDDTVESCLSCLPRGFEEVIQHAIMSFQMLHISSGYPANGIASHDAWRDIDSRGHWTARSKHVASARAGRWHWHGIKIRHPQQRSIEGDRIQAEQTPLPIIPGVLKQSLDAYWVASVIIHLQTRSRTPPCSSAAIRGATKKEHWIGCRSAYRRWILVYDMHGGQETC